ncbi:hypothetical protein DK26_03490 [Bosea sp. WAO]|uniref:hypothetical protein n=1 Tax=Bosea sp. WAO TaxID=406341 RepID=UPI000749FD83|nr:hypothetical protein [Bosea sp. WAO]KUL97014.1 hypothetical protein DK26_03490 [Bosea sp. WAO]
MVKLFVVLGLALLAGGAYAIVDGWPYRVLERGFTEVILGALSFAAGLLMLSAAAILAEIRRLKTLVASAVTAVSLNAVRHDDRAPVPMPTPITPRDEVRPSGTGLGGAAVAAGAGAIALGGALTGLSNPERRAGDDEAAAERVAASIAPAAEEPEPLAEPPEPKLATDHDDWLLPPASRDAEVPGSTEAVEKVEPDFFEAALLPMPAQDPMRDPEGKPADLSDEPEAEPEADQASENQTELAFEPKSEVQEEPEAEAKDDAPAAEAAPIWWPQVDRAGDEAKTAPKAATADDDFSALRAQLTDALAKPGAAPEIEPPRRSLDSVSDWMAPRPWPPVTQPRSSDTLDALEEPAAATDEIPAHTEEAAEAASELEEEALPSVATAEDEPEIASEPEAQAAAPEFVHGAEEPAAPEAEAPAPEADKPSASEEGIVGAYQVGETHFTIYADGSIQARTPDGDYAFASMDELKAYLASEKSRLDSRPG